MSTEIQKANELIKTVKGQALTHEARVNLAVELAALLLTAANKVENPKEKLKQTELANMMNDPSGKAFTIAMTDQCFRSKNPLRVADQLQFLLKKFQIPKYLSSNKQLSFKVFQFLGKPFASLLVPFVRKMIRKATSDVIMPGESEELTQHILSRAQEGVRVNLNRLGESILGEEEAKKRLNTYLSDLSRPEVDYISIKISTLYSQINLLDWDETLAILSQRYKQLLRSAKGYNPLKFINLDMEEYRDLQLTVELFRQVLDDPEFSQVSAGIVLQSYIPDSYLYQQELTLWAIRRLASGGSPIKIRIVKGANLGMERIESSLRGWPQAPYLKKMETDANFKRMVMYGSQPENAKAVHLGIGSHNLFDIAYAIIIRSERNVEPFISFEVLEGMADPIRRVVQEVTNDALVYCPAAKEKDFQYAIGYLMRRLDENTAPENFLRHLFGLTTESQEWKVQVGLFYDACNRVNSLSSNPNRTQNRNLKSKIPSQDVFKNVSDTDFTLTANRQWIKGVLNKWSQNKGESLPIVIGGNTIEGPILGVRHDPSNPNVPLYTYTTANNDQVSQALKSAHKTFTEFSKTSPNERSQLLANAAETLSKRRGDLIGAMVADGGKTVIEADVEISEAIDFANYYRYMVKEFDELEDLSFSAKGVIFIAPPWNFPCSIPCSGIFAALASGNTVLFKPSSETVLVGWILCQALWDAGISKEVLQFIPCAEEPTGDMLLTDPRLNAVVLTGATSTAKHFLNLRPGLDLMAETGGKNSMIITSMCDRDLAIKDLIQSAFGHSGQKCSACSLAILESEVYDDKEFIATLKDAVESLKVDSQWNLGTKINPLIHAPNIALDRGLTQLEEGESWIIRPKQDPKYHNRWSPGIKQGVKAGSFTHQTELFGPVLGLMRANHLVDAINLANGTPYGLTAGLHSLDEREHNYWISHIEAGNLYINRSTTGAIVQRQPFGGTKASSFGKGAKAGGPNYVLQFMHATQKRLPQDLESNPLFDKDLYPLIPEKNQSIWDHSIGSYTYYWKHYFTKRHDPSKILGQDNYFYYVPHKLMLFRVQANDDITDIFRVIVAAKICGTSLIISSSNEIFSKISNIVLESDEQFAERLIPNSRVRLLSIPSTKLTFALANAAANVILAPVLANGRLELLNYLREVSLSVDTHRYGNLTNTLP